MSELNNKDIRLINKSKRKNEYLTIHNKGYIRDIRLSLKAKGLLTLMLTNKDDWVIHLNEIAKHSSDGISALYSGSKELILCKYIKKIQDRDEKGHFRETTYYIYDEPYDDSIIPLYFKPKDSIAPHVENPYADKPQADLPHTENRTLTNNNLNKNNTKLTATHHSVNESIFVSKIKILFNGVYPFDRKFENEVLAILSNTNIEETNLESYLDYVYERTKSCDVHKSFEGLFRKLALSKSITIDFNNSSYIKKVDKSKKGEILIKYINCPICSTRFSEYESSCPTCGVALKAINDQRQPEFIAKKKIYEMNKLEKEAYELALSKFSMHVKENTKRKFLLENEKIHFWAEYGLLDL